MTQEEKENIIELQKIDCNCNDCLYMERDFNEYKKWHDWNLDIQHREFLRKREHAFKIANECEDAKGKETLLNIAKKMVFSFDKSGLLSYGNCKKFERQVSFIPNMCQIENQNCFTHRKSPNK